MKTFTFETTPKIVSGPGSTAGMGEILAGLGARRVALVSDEGVLAAGLAEPARLSIVEAGLGVEIIADVLADPPESRILHQVATARDAGCDAVCAVGGGSPMDTAKLIAVLLGAPQEIGECYGVGQVKGRRVPLVLAPTTAGTGSEVTPIAIVTTGAAEKKGVVAPQLYPDAAILDAGLTVGLPAPVTAATGIDAMVHAIEAITSAIKANPISDGLARQALTLLGANIRRACETPGDLAAREGMLLGSMLAGMAFANAPVAAVHALAYPLGGHHKVPHGLSNALVLPHVLAFNAEVPAARAAYAGLAPLIFPDLADQAEAERTVALIERLRRLGPELGMAGRLSDLGINHNHLPRLAEDAIKQTRLLVNNPREVTEADALAIYQAAL